MYERVLTINYITCKDCFCYLSQVHFKYIEQGAALQLHHEDKNCYLSVKSSLNLKDDQIGINSLYAKALGIVNGETVTISLCNNVTSVNILTISTVTSDDYKIIELLAENVEQMLLDQIKVIGNYQKFVIWISNSLNVTVHVDKIEPNSPGRLCNLTQVVVKEPSNHKKVNKKVQPYFYQNLVSYFLNNKEKVVEENSFLKNYLSILQTDIPLVLRLLPSVNFVINKNLFLQPFIGFIKSSSLPKQFCNKTADYVLFKVKLLNPPEDSFVDVQDNIKNIFIQVFILDNLVSKEDLTYLDNTLLVNDSVLNYFSVKCGSKVLLEPQFENNIVDLVEIGCKKENLVNVIGDFKLFLADNCKNKKFLLNSDVTIKITDKYGCMLKFDDGRRKHCVFSEDVVRDLKIISSEVVVSNYKCNFEKVDKKFEACTDISNIEEILNQSVRCLTEDLTEGLKSNNILIVGKPGTGKTTITKLLINKFSQHPFYLYNETINCKNIKGKTIESLNKFFATTFANLIYYQPSILIIDDLHVLCAEGEEQMQETLYFNKVCEMFSEIINEHLAQNKIFIIATCESTLKLNSIIYSSRGRHIFKNVFSIKDLDKNDRKQLLTFLLIKKAELDNVDLDLLSVKTEGFVIQDIVDFVDKTIYEKYKCASDKVTTDHCEVALKNTSTLSLRDVKLHSPGHRDFSDVGGLEEVKTILIESMLWPTKYPNLFGKAPLRLQSGLLLYGPPGTGKTILAGAAAKQCGLRLISIKGPELLSKYVGASEQAVRNVFQKAQSAKPCILFFDEFDSLATRRGHDNTGVTDRVVNQFLTQLDGIESLSGVCVLAATSRPDLLDPALLRPGRLDKQILCPLPDKNARIAILKALSKTLTLSSDVEFETIAEKTEGFSGADLQSVLYTAQLSSVEHLLGNNKENQIDSAEVNQNHLEEAVKNTRPSLTKQEKLKYERIYSKFQKGMDIQEFTSSQRATMA